MIVDREGEFDEGIISFDVHLQEEYDQVVEAFHDGKCVVVLIKKYYNNSLRKSSFSCRALCNIHKGCWWGGSSSASCSTQ